MKLVYFAALLMIGNLLACSDNKTDNGPNTPGVDSQATPKPDSSTGGVIPDSQVINTVDSGTGGKDAAHNVDSSSSSAKSVIADHTTVPQYATAPATISGLNIVYFHTSHGSQLITGLNMLGRAHNFIEEISTDLGDTNFDTVTRTHLGNNGNGHNVVIWSWCGQVSSSTEQSINTYLQKMSALEHDYPAIKFIYMTGHLDATGEAGNLRARNQQIRTYCQTNKKIFFDFEDIELYDPNGVRHGTTSDTDACQWCSTWCAAHSTDPGCTCSDCAHSHCFNCYRKGMAFWRLLANLT